MSHVTNSLCGGEFLRVSRGTGPQPPGRCRVPIRSAQSRSPHSRVRDGHGAYRLCCGLACGDDARAPRHRASGPRRPLPARARPPPRAGIFRAIALFAALPLGPGVSLYVESRATRTERRQRRPAKTPTRTAGRLKTLKTRDTERRQSEAQERRGLRGFRLHLVPRARSLSATSQSDSVTPHSYTMTRMKLHRRTVTNHGRRSYIARPELVRCTSSSRPLSTFKCSAPHMIHTLHTMLSESMSHWPLYRDSFQ